MGFDDIGDVEFVGVEVLELQLSDGHVFVLPLLGIWLLYHICGDFVRGLRHFEDEPEYSGEVEHPGR